jgi:F-type H+-transporting ATPase subunit a
MILALLQGHGAEPAAAGAAQAAEHAAAGHGEHIPVIVEWINNAIGPAVFALQAQIMPPIYAIFGGHWPGADLTFEQYRHSGNLPIPTHVVMFTFVMIVAVGVLTYLRGKLSVESPNTRQQSFEVGVEGIRGLLVELVGPKGVKHFPVVATFATLILLSNLTGMLPDMVAPTANFNVTLALALTSFIYYNYVGIKENGLLAHLKHFAGPVPAVAFLMFPIEIVSNLARILSLSLRLFGNIYGEEQASGTIAALAPWIIPTLLMPLGLLTSVLQTFIFIMLSMIYLGEVSHHSEEHAEPGHGHEAVAH